MTVARIPAATSTHSSGAAPAAHQTPRSVTAGGQWFKGEAGRDGLGRQGTNQRQQARRHAPTRRPELPAAAAGSDTRRLENRGIH